MSANKDFPTKFCQNRGYKFPICQAKRCCPKPRRRKHEEINDTESVDFSINFEGEEDNYLELEDDQKNHLYLKGFPFYVPTRRESSPRLCLYQNFTNDDYCYLIDSDWLGFRKQKWSRTKEIVCTEILRSVRSFCDMSNFSTIQGLSLLELFYSCFQFLVLGPIITLEDICEYFRQTLLLYAVHDPPESLEIFNPMECFSISKKFFDIFECNFTILEYILIPEYKILIPVEDPNE